MYVHCVLSPLPLSVVIEEEEEEGEEARDNQML